MPRRSFRHRAETFGYDTSQPWAHDALRLLLCVPRLYQPLLDAWEDRHPGTAKALDRLVDAGFVEFQDGVVVDTRTAELADYPSAPVARYRTTAKGRRLYADVVDDIRVLEDEFSNLTEANVKDLARLLSAFDLDGSHARYGLSVPAATDLTTMAPRTARWWVNRLVDTGHLRQLDFKLADTREVIPAHWRPTRMLARQLQDVLEEFHPAPEALRVQWRLGRARFLDDIDPSRIGISGATDFDHDVEAQQLLGRVLVSPAAATDGTFVVEPRLQLPADKSTRPWSFTPGGRKRVFYQPDAELREVRDGRLWRTVIEYERYQSRRDAWSHIERFVGWMAVTALPFERAVLRFVLDGEPRVRSYVTLIEGFAAYSLDAPEAMPGNDLVLMVSSTDRLQRARDPLADDVWFRIPLATPGAPGVPRLHPPKDSPYDSYVLR